MARFESPWQIVGLFVMAGLLSMVIMSALRIEAQKRYGQESIDGPEGEAEPEPQPNEEDFGDTLILSDPLTSTVQVNS